MRRAATLRQYLENDYQSRTLLRLGNSAVTTRAVTDLGGGGEGGRSTLQSLIGCKFRFCMDMKCPNYR